MVDLEQLPLPGRELYLKYDYFQTKDVHDFVVSMDCPYNCTYCFFHQWNELYRGTPDMKSYRLKTVEHCMQEIKALAARVSIPLVSYVDRTFNLDKAWMLDFLRAYQERIDLPFTLNLRPNLVGEEIVQAIARTGRCRIIRMGVEVGDEDYRKRVLRKKISNAQILEAGRLLRKHGIPLMTYTMYCLPGETLEQALKTVEMGMKYYDVGVWRLMQQHVIGDKSKMV